MATSDPERYWANGDWQPPSAAFFAKRVANMLERQGVKVVTGRANAELEHGVVPWSNLIEIFAEAGDAVIDQHVQHQREKEASVRNDATSFPVESSYHWATRMLRQIEQGPRSLEAIADEFRSAMAVAVDEYVRDHARHVDDEDTSERSSQSPEDRSETPHQNRMIMRVHFLNGNDFMFNFPNADIKGGWTFRNIRGVDMLIVGHGVPRKMFPLCNIHSIELLEDL